VTLEALKFRTFFWQSPHLISAERSALDRYTNVSAENLAEHFKYMNQVCRQILQLIVNACVQNMVDYIANPVFSTARYTIIFTIRMINLGVHG